MRVRHIVVSSLALATFACGVLIGIDDRSLDDQGAESGVDASTSEAAVSDATDSSATDGPGVDADCPDACTRCNPVDNRCVIDCAASDGGCKKTVVCPPGLACRVLCESDSGKPCEDLTVDCTQAKSCRVDCNGVSDICDGMKITAGPAPICLTCKGENGACDQIQCSTTSTCTRICERGLGGACTNNTCGGSCDGGSACP